ncbi:MAG: hypothetical protein GXY55_06190 [Phycisphaerae bacterium]|nr:hypothetical protein [Phycisphaerae bacterium]
MAAKRRPVLVKLCFIVEVPGESDDPDGQELSRVSDWAQHAVERAIGPLPESCGWSAAHCAYLDDDTANVGRCTVC